MSQSYNNERLSVPQEEALEIVDRLEPRLIMVGLAAVEHPLEKGRYIPATGLHYDMLGGTIEVDELDPNRVPVDGRYPNMRYGVMVYHKSFADRAGRRATFSRDIGMVDGWRRTVVYDVLEEGSIAKFIYDFDGRRTVVVASELNEDEENSFIKQLSKVVSVHK